MMQVKIEVLIERCSISFVFMLAGKRHGKLHTLKTDIVALIFDCQTASHFPAPRCIKREKENA